MTHYVILASIVSQLCITKWHLLSIKWMNGSQKCLSFLGRNPVSLEILTHADLFAGLRKVCPHAERNDQVYKTSQTKVLNLPSWSPHFLITLDHKKIVPWKKNRRNLELGWRWWGVFCRKLMSFISALPFWVRLKNCPHLREKWGAEKIKNASRKLIWVLQALEWYLEKFRDHLKVPPHIYDYTSWVKYCLH